MVPITTEKERLGEIIYSVLSPLKMKARTMFVLNCLALQYKEFKNFDVPIC